MIRHAKQRTLAAAAPAANGDAKHLNGAASAPLAGDQAMAPDDEVLRISLALIVASPHNWRKTFDQASLEELAASIRAQGMLVPLIVREAPSRGARPAYELVDGERRLRAARIAGLAVVPAIVRKMTDVQALEAIIASAEQREDIPALEKADGYHALTKLGVSPEEIARKVGKSASTIHGLLKLRNLPEPARKALAAGVLPVETAKLIARVPVEATRAKVALHVLADETWWDSSPRPSKEREPMTYRRAKEFIANRCLTELKKAPFDPDGPALIPGATSCDICPKRAGNAKKVDPEGYTGVRDDMCTDPECFRAKSAAWVEQQAAEAKAEGLKVLSAKQAAEVFSPHSHDLQHYGPGAEFVDLAEKCYDDPKRRTFKAIIGKALEGQVIAFDHRGKRRELLPKAAAAAALKKAGVKGAAGQDPKAAAERKRAEAKRKAGQAAALEAQRLVFERTEQMVAQFEPANIERFRALMVAIFETTWHEARARVLKRHGVEEEAEDWLGRSSSAPQLLAVVAEAKAAEAANLWGREYGSLGEEFFNPFGIDPAEFIRNHAAKADGEKIRAAKAKAGGRKK